MNILFWALIIFWIWVIPSAEAHPGRKRGEEQKDKKGCHLNTKKGKFHCHIKEKKNLPIPVTVEKIVPGKKVVPPPAVAKKVVPKKDSTLDQRLEVVKKKAEAEGVRLLFTSTQLSYSYYGYPKPSAELEKEILDLWKDFTNKARADNAEKDAKSPERKIWNMEQAAGLYKEFLEKFKKSKEEAAYWLEKRGKEEWKKGDWYKYDVKVYYASRWVSLLQKDIKLNVKSYGVTIKQVEDYLNIPENERIKK